MELTSKEVIKGSDGVMTCTVTEISSKPTITWIVNGKEYAKDSTDDKYKVSLLVDGLLNLSNTVQPDF